MVKEIVVARKRCFFLEGKHQESLETRLNDFLKDKVQSLWPDGWMSLTTLSKICGNIPDSKKNSPSPSKPPVLINQTTSALELPQNLSMNPSLSITPLPATPTQQNIVVSTANSDSLEVKLNSVLPDLQITKTVNSASNGLKQETVTCDSKVEVYDQPPKLQPEIVIPKQEPDCQVIDLTGHGDMKRKPSSCSKTKNRYYSDGGDKVKMNNEGDDIQKVMEGLKVLQKMSSPIKTENTTTSSPVSVIAFNKSYSPKSTVSQPSTSTNSIRTAEFAKADFCSGFQDAFQKQLLGDVNFMKTSSSQPATSFKATNMHPSDDYMQVNNDNFRSIISLVSVDQLMI